MHIGTVITGSAGSSAVASITDDGDNNFTLNMTIPRGDTGSRGSTGPQGPTGPSAISNYSLGSAAGYIVLNNGFKIQWKTLASSSSNTASTITPPINFTTFSWTMSQSASTSTSAGTGSASSLQIAQVAGSSVPNASSLNSFKVYAHPAQTRHVIMLGV